MSQQRSSASFEQIVCGIIAAAAVKEGARRYRSGEQSPPFRIADVLDVYHFASHGTERQQIETTEHPGTDCCCGECAG